MMDAMMSTPLSEADPDIYRLVASERTRQQCGLSLVASENLTSASVLKTLSSCLTNKYCEGLPNPRDHGSNRYLDRIEHLCQERALQAFNYRDHGSNRYLDRIEHLCQERALQAFNYRDHGSNRYLDRIEHLCQERALQAFNLPPTEWGVNVQPYSGTPANNVVYMALLRPHDRIMYLDVLDGGHVSHGHMTLEERLSSASVFYETMPYKVNPRTGLIDYGKFARIARMFKPKLIIAGSASYSRCLNYKKFRRISDEVGAYLMADAGQIAGLVQAGVLHSPFHHCDIVSIATHHTLRGPRAGIVFYRKGVRSASQDGNTVMYDLPQRLGQGVFPEPDQGPGLMLAGRADQIAAIACALQQTKSPLFKEYQKQVLRNAKTLCFCLQRRGYKIVSGGTDIHLFVVDLRNHHISGETAEYVLDRVNITCSRSAVPGEKSLSTASGIRLGTPSLTTRGMVENDMETVSEFIHRGLVLAKDALISSKLRFEALKTTILEDKIIVDKLQVLRKEVEEYTEGFPFPSLHQL